MIRKMLCFATMAALVLTASAQRPRTTVVTDTGLKKVSRTTPEAVTASRVAKAAELIAEAQARFDVETPDYELALVGDANGAGFLVALCGDIMRMPALPKVPAACAIRVDAEGHISGMKG